MRKHELAKLDIIYVLERHLGIKLHFFEASTSIGFTMRLTCTRADYDALIVDLGAIGLVPNLERPPRKLDATREYAVFVEVPEGWRPVSEQSPKAES